MKFNDVIIKEGLSDWMFGDKAKGGAAKTSSNGQQKAPRIDGKSGLTAQDKLSYKFFVTDFQSDALSSINAGIRSGIINPPMAAGTNQPNNMAPQTPANVSETYLKLDNIIESIITEQGEVSQTNGMSLMAFIKDWFSQWMQNIEYGNSKPVLYNMMQQLERTYNASPNPEKPNIDKNILMQLADGAWAASSIGGATPKGAENANGAKEIEKTLKGAEGQGKAQKYQYPQAPAGTSFKNQEYDILVNDAGNWIQRSSQNKYGPVQSQKFNQMFADKPQHFEGPHKKAGPSINTGQKESDPAVGAGSQGRVEPVGGVKGTVAESKTQSAIRTEKIALLQTR